MANKRHVSHFAEVPTNNAKRSSFLRPSTHKTTFDANNLVPVYVDEILPGDTFKVTGTTFARLATPIKPSMDNMYLDIHYFFVPSRLIWDNWQAFMGERKNPDDTIDYLVPTLDPVFTDVSDHTNSIYDYMGIPHIPSGSCPVSALPFRAYNLIWNEWYRDQNLQDSVDVPMGDEPDDLSTYKLLPRGKRHDYFTSALPFPQKGDPVSLSLSGDAPVTGEGFPEFTGIESSGTRYDGLILAADTGTGGGSENTGVNVDLRNAGINEDYQLQWYNTRLKAELGEVTAVTINQLRQAFQLQRFLERDARSGTRYIEVIKAHFNVTNPDYRLQRPEYLGGSHEDVNFTTIAQTTQTLDTSTPQGNLAAMATVAGRNKAFSKSFTEHGYVIGLASVYADQTYQQGIERMWFRQTRVDYYWPTFAHLGEQEVFNKEIYATGDTDQDNQVFGYQERYAEYRYKPNRVSGLFRSSVPTSLDVWHYAQDFENLPVLNGEFIACDSPIKRNSGVPSEPDFVADFYFGNNSVRAMPMYGVPGYVDHF